ncbi:MFS transporter [Brevibacillus centrosporus]|uniref:MFS transporter, PPP family, 3-phenylpropionic acid transporter n=1 Tax=Brevibacillus centrosporus TaxID=54910 RepID=A0A1I3ZWP8_9BACL|nr:MFS transporter [Brevibacillus centrosporus]MEC2131788.1 MFS transporter [Brevibacillus centrosporus]MED4908500.1 MFS transporter [Brevibacillus centrosporus]RNB67431.1 MFS transporter [Brevibacillus centrosporus]SFK48463.1 MFS transporter, PPP family, 3-phenylpropionic acid transporter [Brevibacillus centrosporus]GED33609.1 MFS transporter [Brevibacillus centrosporus]
MSESLSGRFLGGAGGRYVSFCALYLFIYYGFGAFSPLITQYYKSIHLTGTQIGMISAVAPVVSIVAQPMWGMICDRFQIRKAVLLGTLLASGLVGLLFTAVSTYAFVFLLYILLSFFQSAIIPVSDSLTLNYTKKHQLQFGDIRMWGAVGFALAAFVTGLFVERWGPSVLFISYCLALITALLFLMRLPGEVTESSRFTVSIFKGMKQLLRIPRFLLFLLASFCMFGAVNANNIWFSLYYQEIGGTVAGVGLAFLLFAGSEAPFMKLAGYFVRRWGIETTLLGAAIFSAIRWFWYSSAPSTTAVLLIFFIQGVSVGFYLATAAQFVRENTPASLQVTALAVFFSVGSGLGTMLCNLLAGWIKDEFSTLAIYLFFGVVTTLGILPLLVIRFGPWKRVEQDEGVSATQ